MRRKTRYYDDADRDRLARTVDAEERIDAAMTQALLEDQQTDTTPRHDDEDYVLWVVGGGHATDSWGR